MSDYTGVLWIVGILGIVLLMGIIKSRAEWVINFVLRGIMGMLGIYFINMLTASQASGAAVGYNLLTFFISGVLGIPGIALMYGIHFYMLL
ncbi:MAG: pro-sigmaK processing inhibitor BofA family protein [Lachnospiraceae bacterium]|nr:pro-sigmaK processing inhibitor BofA family protein [Lachnospiraceae bacterium]